MSLAVRSEFIPEKLFGLYKQARNQLRRFTPESTIVIGIDLLYRAARGDVQILRNYQPWHLLLMIKWTLQEFDVVSHRRDKAQLKDVHRVLNYIYEMTEHVRMPSEYGHVALFMRHLAFQQFWLQRHVDGSAIARQELLFSGLPQDHPFQRDFFRIAGLHCDEFVELAFSLITWFISDEKRRSVNQISFSTLDSTFTARTLKPFLAAIGCSIEEAHLIVSTAEEKKVSLNDQMLLPTPFLMKPLLKSGQDYFPLSPNLLFRSLEHFIYRTLKREDKESFSAGFGPVFERYLKQCLEAASVLHTSEEILNPLLGGSGKCVDFVITEGDSNVLIDAKGVEASRVARVAHTAEAVFRSLKQSAAKAMLQGMETAHRIASAKSKLPQLGTGTNYMIAVTLEPLYLGGSTHFEPIFASVFKKLHGTYGDVLPIPIENIFFMSIEEFEALLASIREGQTTLVKTLRFAQEQDSRPETRKFAFVQHMEALGLQPQQLPNIKRALDAICERALSRIVSPD